MSDIRKYLTFRLHDAECVNHWASLSDGNFLWMSHMMPVIEGETSTCAEDLEEELRSSFKKIRILGKREIQLVQQLQEKCLNEDTITPLKVELEEAKRVNDLFYE